MIPNKPGFSLRESRTELLGRSHRDWRTCIRLDGRYLPDTGDVVSLGDQYFLSLGAHDTHQHLLMDKAAAEPLTVEKSSTACALIAFATDSPVVPEHTEQQKQYRCANFEAKANELKRAGLRSVQSYFEALAASAEAVVPLVNMTLPNSSVVIRVLPDSEPKQWPYLCWPTSEATWRGLTAYWSAMISVALPGRILNFWRAMEAASDKPQRYSIFSNLQSRRICAVKTQLKLGHTRRDRHIIDGTLRLKRHAVSRRDTLMKVHGSAEKAIDWLYREVRGKAAHADSWSLDYEGLPSLAEQLHDSILLQYMARVAIEQSWS